jgi:hypothetical protein
MMLDMNNPGPWTRYLRAGIMTANPLQPEATSHRFFIPIFYFILCFNSIFLLGRPIWGVSELFEMIGLFSVAFLPVFTIGAIVVYCRGRPCPCRRRTGRVITTGRRPRFFLFNMRKIYACKYAENINMINISSYL